MNTDVAPAIQGSDTVLFTRAPYQLANLYVRGSFPEFVAGSFVPAMSLATLIALAASYWNARRGIRNHAAT